MAWATPPGRKGPWRSDPPGFLYSPLQASVLQGHPREDLLPTELGSLAGPGRLSKASFQDLSSSEGLYFHRHQMRSLQKLCGGRNSGRPTLGPPLPLCVGGAQPPRAEESRDFRVGVAPAPELYIKGLGVSCRPGILPLRGLQPERDSPRLALQKKGPRARAF